MSTFEQAQSTQATALAEAEQPDGIEQQEVAEVTEATQQKEALKYADASEERKLEIDQSVDPQVTELADAVRAFNQLSMDTGHLRDQDLSARIYALHEKYKGMIMGIKNEVANGQGADAALAEYGDITSQIESDIRAIQALAEQSQNGYAAQQAERAQLRDAQMGGARTEINQIYQTQDSESVNTIDTAPIATPLQPVEPGVPAAAKQEVAEKAEVKLRRGETRLRTEGYGVYSKIDALLKDLKADGYINDEQAKELTLRGSGYLESQQRLEADAGFVPNKKNVKSAGEFLQKLQDISILERSKDNVPLSRDEQKRLKKIK